MRLLSKREKAFPKVSSENRVLRKSKYPITESQGMVLMKYNRGCALWFDLVVVKSLRLVVWRCYLFSCREKGVV